MSYDAEQYKADIENKRWCQFTPTWERPVLSALIKAALAGGKNTISVFDSEEYVVKRSKDQALIRSQLCHTDEDQLLVRDEDGEQVGWFYLIYNNGSEDDPMVVISDYSANDFCKAIVKQLDKTYGE